MPGLALNDRAAPPPGVGWFGKLPSRGDFVGAGGPPALFAAWRDWCRPGLAAVARGGGPAEDAFLVAPFRRLAVSAGVFGPHGALGVACPGADRAGRLFPLLVAAERRDLDAADEAALETALAAAEDWAEIVETALLAALDPAASPEALSRALPVAPGPGAAATESEAEAPSRLPAALAADPLPQAVAPPPRLGAAAPAPAGPLALVRTASPVPRRLLHRGPPDAALFAALFGPPGQEVGA
ncbi:MAG: type VI secretion system-associated protein TagF [Paracoccaceae bacterium]